MSRADQPVPGPGVDRAADRVRDAGATLRYELDPSVEFVDRGRALLGGDPVRLIRLSAAGARLVRGWASGGVVVDAATATGVRALVERLDAAGMVHPRVAVPPLDATAAALTVIVPTYRRTGPLDRCLAALVRCGVSDLVVVDDASPNGDEVRAVAARHGATYLRRPDNGGPAAARMSGWRHLLAGGAPAFVGFVDSDIEVDDDWLAPVLGLFANERTALVASRVRHVAAGASALDRYEAANSPLDLGDRPARIVAGTQVSYVPAAALVVRSTAFTQVGGFEESLVVGEDVDLLWRLADTGWVCRYEPASTVSHHGRSSLREVLTRRSEYGGSAALLDARHPGSLPPLRVNRWSAAVVGSLALGRPVLAAALWAWTARTTASRLGALGDAGSVAVRLTGLGHLGAIRQVGRASLRPWFPLTALGALASRRFRRVAALGVLIEPLVQWRRRRPPLDPIRWTLLFLADDLAYSVGVWRGCVEARSAGALMPSISRVSR